MGTSGDPYYKPKAPVHLLVGSAVSYEILIVIQGSEISRAVTKNLIPLWRIPNHGVPNVLVSMESPS